MSYRNGVVCIMRSPHAPPYATDAGGDLAAERVVRLAPVGGGVSYEQSSMAHSFCLDHLVGEIESGF